MTDRTAYLGKVSAHRIHPGEGLTDDCMVEVIARPHGGTARAVVRCLFTREVAHVHPVSVRPL